MESLYSNCLLGVHYSGKYEVYIGYKENTVTQLLYGWDRTVVHEVPTPEILSCDELR